MTYSPQGFSCWSGPSCRSGTWRRKSGAPASFFLDRRAFAGVLLFAFFATMGCVPAKSDKDATSGELVSGSESNESDSSDGSISPSLNQPPESPEVSISEAAPVPVDPTGDEKPTVTSDSTTSDSAAQRDIAAEVGTVEKTTAGDGQAERKDAGSNPPVVSAPRNPSNRFLPPNRNPQATGQAAKSDKETVEDRKAREAAKKRGEITFDDLKFDMEKGAIFTNDMLGAANWELHEKVWKIRGFILPTTLFSQTGITEFVLVRDNQECCFGPGAALYDCIIVKMAPGKTINYTTRVVSVKGKLEIDTESFQYPDDGGHYAVYKMTAEEVK